MSQESTEEKKHVPSQRKLDKLRKDGKFPTSPEARGLFILVISIIIIWNSSEFIKIYFNNSINYIFEFDESVNFYRKTTFFLNPLIILTGIFLSVLFMITILISILDIGGLSFSGSQFSEGLTKINPLTNIKEKFQIRSLYELAKSIIITLIFIVSAAVVLSPLVEQFFYAPTCGENCSYNLFKTSMSYFLILIIIICIVTLIIEYNASRFFFKRQNKMTNTEVKKEEKENYGSPEQKQHMKSLRKNFYNDSDLPGNTPNIVIYGDHKIYCIFYDRNTENPPICVNIFNNSNQNIAVEELKNKGATVIHDPIAAATLQQSRRGEEIPEESYSIVAKAIQKSNFFKN